MCSLRDSNPLTASPIHLFVKAGLIYSQIMLSRLVEEFSRHPPSLVILFALFLSNIKKHVKTNSVQRICWCSFLTSNDHYFRNPSNFRISKSLSYTNCSFLFDSGLFKRSYNIFYIRRNSYIRSLMNCL